MGRKKLTFEFVKEKFKEANCELLETEYMNSCVKMRYKCKCDNISEIAYDKLRKGQHCRGCGGNEKLDFEFVKAQFIQADCILLEDYYTNSYTKMRYICDCGNEAKIAYDSFRVGKRCRKCSGKEKLTLEYVQGYFKKYDYVCLEDVYINVITKMAYICDKGHQSSTKFNSFKSGFRCPFCINKTEQIVKKFLEENYTNVISQVKFEWCKDKNHLPFDFLLEDLNLIIEVDGRQHFKQVQKWKSPKETHARDILKMKVALDQGYSIIRIFQEDIYNNSIDWKKLLKEYIKNYENSDCIYISKDPELYNNYKNAMSV